MPALNFSPQFAGLVQTGAKRQTIRKIRKRPIRRGDRLYLYTGQRTPNATLLRVEVCNGVSQVCIGEVHGRTVIEINGRKLRPDEAKRLAVADGFDNADGMVNWFRLRHGLPFYGVMIRW